MTPLRPEHALDLSEIIFSDPEVMSTMHQDTRIKGTAQKWASHWINEAGAPADHIWGDRGMGLYGIFPNNAPDLLIGVAGFHMKRGKDKRWKGQFIYSLGSVYHDPDVAQEVADALRPRL